LPFNGNAEIDILESILDSTIVIPDTFLDGTLVDDAARDLIRRMICRDINKRVEVQDILSLPYFTDDVGIFIDSTEDCKRMLPFLSASSIESANSNYLTTKKSIKDTSSSDRSCSIISDPFNLICGEWSGRDGNVSIGNDNDNNDNDDNDDGDDCGDGNKKFIPQPPPTAKRDKLDRSKYIDKIKNIKEHRKLTITDIDQSITFID